MPDFSLETEYDGRVAGVDEAGCGPLAGPVVAAAVVFGAGVPDDLAAVIDDSKSIRAAQREAIAQKLKTVPGIDFGIGAASVREIHSINILKATHLAMQRAITHLTRKPDFVLVDGNRKPPLSIPLRTVVKGDTISLSIAAASILAKVTRDRIMTQLSLRWPAYGWAGNAGYGTAAHRSAIAAHGCTPHHRQGFGTVRKQLSLTLANGDSA